MCEKGIIFIDTFHILPDELDTQLFLRDNPPIDKGSMCWMDECWNHSYSMSCLSRSEAWWKDLHVQQEGEVCQVPVRQGPVAAGLGACRLSPRNPAGSRHILLTTVPCWLTPSPNPALVFPHSPTSNLPSIFNVFPWNPPFLDRLQTSVSPTVLTPVLCPEDSMAQQV